MKKAPRSEQFGNKARPNPVDVDDEPEDPLNPAIPRAPLLPHDLHRMANAALPKWSNPPNDKAGERQLLTSQADFEFFREHVDADPPPGATPSTYESAARAPHTDSIPHPPAVKQANSEVARKREAPAPAAPAAGQRSNAGAAAELEAPNATTEQSAGWSRARWPIAVAVVIVAVGGLWWLLL